MHIITKESHIQSRVRIGERAPLVGLILLFIATILIWTRPEWWLITMVLIWVGFIASMVGGYLGERFVGPLAHHKKVPEALKGLDNSYVLAMYQLPSPFVLIEPGGMTVFLVKSQGGDIKYKEGKWHHRQKLGLFRRLAGQEGLGRPERQANLELAQMKKFLKETLPDGLEIPTRCIILFVDPDVQLDAEDSPVPALRAVKLKGWLRGEGRRSTLPASDRQQLLEALDIDV